MKIKVEVEVPDGVRCVDRSVRCAYFRLGRSFGECHLFHGKCLSDGDLKCQQCLDAEVVDKALKTTQRVEK
jgi:hypothetical protein